MLAHASQWSGLMAGLLFSTLCGFAQEPVLKSLTRNPDGSVTVLGEVPASHHHAVLEVLHGDDVTMSWENFISGPLSGPQGGVLNAVTFTIPPELALLRCILRMRTGVDSNVPSAPYSGTTFMLPSYDGGGDYVPSQNKITHLLNRAAYGPSVSDYQLVNSIGVSNYIVQQLAPEGIDESANAALNSRVDDLFYKFLPNTGDPFISKGDNCLYFEGTSEPPATWSYENFDDSSWTSAPMGLGYGDDDDATVLNMNGNYSSVYVRLPFTVTDPSAIKNLVMNINFDDGFVAYLNGSEVARSNVVGSPPVYTATATSSGGNVDDNTVPKFFDLTTFKGLIVTGDNVLAIQGHNQSLSGSSDFSLNADLVSVDGAPYPAIKGARELQHLMHVRGVYSKRQLQAVLGEFWENHFTTELPKVLDYFDNLSEYREIASVSTTEANRIGLQADIEAAAVEFAEYQFFYDNALGNFGDLLLYSATSPAMLIYLDSVQNKKGAPNENYAREIFELSAFGVDNGYTQGDIEELARCFTGWTVRKVNPADKLSFPDSARTPPVDEQQVVSTETVFLPIGAIWKYKKGTEAPPSDWAQPGFVPTGWLDGATGIGRGDNDDATVLNDLPASTGNPGYTSVYTRFETTIPSAAGFDALLLEIAYDDGIVVYINGTEASRSYSMRNAGSPPAFDATSYSHEVTESHLQIDLKNYAGPATIAVQIHNASLSSSDLSFLPRIVGLNYTSQSIAITEPFGEWTFRFNPEQYDLGAKTIFAGKANEIQIPARQKTDPGLANYYKNGVDDAIGVIDAMVANPAAAQFICIKLVNRFVSDEISLDSYKDRSAPGYLLTLADQAVAAWNSTTPAGNIATVMAVILDPVGQSNAFWLDGSYEGKVKNPIEFINSSFRALDADILNSRLPARTIDLGMNLFTRAEPDGFDETGPSWMDTQNLLGRIKFVQGLSNNSGYSYGVWSLDNWLAAYALTTPQSVVDHLNTYIFGGALSVERQQLLLFYADTADDGSSSPYANLTNATQKANRMRKLASLILSTPEFQYQ